MRKSKQVLLSAVLITAITGVKAEAQQACDPQPLDARNSVDTPTQRHHGYYGGRGGRGFLYAFFHFGRNNNHNNQGHPITTTSHPRTGGFGNTLRSSFAGS